MIPVSPFRDVSLSLPYLGPVGLIYVTLSQNWQSEGVGYSYLRFTVLHHEPVVAERRVYCVDL